MVFKKDDIIFYQNKEYQGNAWYWVKSAIGEVVHFSFVVDWIYDYNAMTVNYKPTLPLIFDSEETNKARLATRKDKRKLIKAILNVERLDLKKKE